MNEKDRGLLIDVINFAQEAIDFMGPASLTEFLDNVLIQRACERCVELVGEAAGNLSESLVDETPDFPWKEAKGMRIILAHRYGSVDTEIIFATVKERLPDLVARVKRLLKENTTP